MLSNQSDKQAFIFLKDVKFADLKALVDYMYKGEVNVAQDQLASFLQTAEALDIKGLAYKDDGSSGEQAEQRTGRTGNVRSGGVKRTASESPPSNTSQPTSQKSDGSTRPRPSSTRQQPAAKRAHLSSAVTSEPATEIPPESDDHFVSVFPKIEEEDVEQSSEDHLEGNNGASSRVFIFIIVY